LNPLVLFVVSAVTLGLEILLTRVFSAVLFASRSFLAISLALLGTGSGALLVYFAKPLDKEKLQRCQILLMALLSLAMAISLRGHRFPLWLPMLALLPLVFLAFAGLGFFLGYAVPLRTSTPSYPPFIGDIPKISLQKGFLRKRDLSYGLLLSIL
jgi:hypothetical protein